MYTQSRFVTVRLTAAYICTIRRRSTSPIRKKNTQLVLVKLMSLSFRSVTSCTLVWPIGDSITHRIRFHVYTNYSAKDGEKRRFIEEVFARRSCIRVYINLSPPPPKPRARNIFLDFWTSSFRSRKPIAL